MALVLQQANVPETGIALILGVDRILDMLRTAVNITGDLTGATFIARTEGEFVETDATSLELGEGPTAPEAAGEVR
jgi:Na+/H+-dicarboxylate symporter